MKNKSSMLINEPPLMVLPRLAAAIGLNESIVMQQLHYWIENQSNAGIDHDGQKWIYNTYEEWQIKNFPFWSVRTIQRIFIRLEEMRLIKTKQLNSGNYDRTKYYTIDYDEVDKLKADQSSQNGIIDITKNGIIDSAKMAHSTYTETTTETTTERLTAEAVAPAQPEKSYVLEREEPEYIDIEDQTKKPTGDHKEMMRALREVTGLDMKIRINAGRIAKASKELRDAGYTPGQVRDFGKAWYKDWRWLRDKKPPAITVICAEIGRLASKPDEQDPDELARLAREMIDRAQQRKDF